MLRVVYLVFNEGYTASSGNLVTRHDLSTEAIRLGRLIVELVPGSETRGLLAMMLLHDSRRAARTSPSGDVILLEDQDRQLWNRDQILEGTALARAALASGRPGPYSIQAAIAAVHADAAVASATDWDEIVGLYDVLLNMTGSPVVRLNRAVAVAMRDGPAAGLALIDELLNGSELTEYRLAHSARGELCRRLGRFSEARLSFLRALELTRQQPERRFLERRLEDLARPSARDSDDVDRPGSRSTTPPSGLGRLRCGLEGG